MVQPVKEFNEKIETLKKQDEAELSFEQRMQKYEDMYFSFDEFKARSRRIMKERFSLSEQFRRYTITKPLGLVKGVGMFLSLFYSSEMRENLAKNLFYMKENGKKTLYINDQYFIFMMRKNSPDEYYERPTSKYNAKMQDIFFEALEKCKDYSAQVKADKKYPFRYKL